MRNTIDNFKMRRYTRLVCTYALLGLLCATSSRAQVINEGFEETVWTSAGSVCSAGNVSPNQGTVTLSYYTSSINGTTVTNSGGFTTNTNTSPNSGKWFYSSGSWSSDTKLNKVHSASHSWKTGGSGSYLITPIITGGVATITFWAAPGSTPFLVVGVNTNASVTATSYAPTTYNTSASSAPLGYTYLTQSFAPGTISSGTGTATFSTMSSFSFTAGSFTGPCRVGFFNATSSGVYIDDIVITSPPPANASKLAITPTPSGVISGNTFSVTVQSQNSANTPTNVTANTDFTLSVATGAGTIGGTVSGTILAGNNSATVNVNYAMVSGETGVSFTATRTAGDALTAGTSSTFSVIAAVPSTSSSVSFGATTGTSIVANFTGGDGARRVVVVKPGNSGTSFIPSVGAGFTGTISDDFLTATDQGSGDKLVYDGTGTSVTVSDLNPGTSYSFSVFEYNGSGVTANYKIVSPGTGVQATATSPSIIASSVTTFGNQVTNSISTEKSYSVSGAFLTGSISIVPPAGFEISTGTGAGFVATNPIILTPVSGTVSPTTIYVRFHPTAVQAYSGNIAHTSTGATQEDVAVSGTGVAPNAVTALAVSHKSDNIMRVTWTAPVGSYDGVMVFARPVNNISYNPSGAGSAYTNANANIASAGVYNVDNFLVYSGTGTSVEVTGLTNNTVYYFQVVTYSGDGYSPAPSTNSTTAVQPTTAFTAGASNLQAILGWTNPGFNGAQINYWDEILVVASSGTAVTAIPTGNGSAYTANLAFGTGTDLGGNNFAVYKGTGTAATVTGLTNGTTYYYATFVRHGNNWSVATTASAIPQAYAINDYGSIATGLWSGTTTWGKWDGSTFVGTATPPGVSDNVYILNGNTVTLDAVKSCNNLHVINGMLYSNKACSNGTASTTTQLTVAGTLVEVGASGQIGNGLADNLADGIGLTLTNAGTTTITGGGTIDFGRLILNTTNSTVTIDNNVGVHYHGSSNGGNASGLYPAASGITLNINSGKTVSMARWSCIFSNTSSNTLQAFNFAINVNGTLTLVPGSPTDPNDRTLLKSYLAMNASTGFVFTLHVGATGVANITELYPNGSGGTVGTVSSIVVDNGGVINVTSLADFGKVSTQTVTGSGTFSLNSGATMKIANVDGLTASSSAGAVQTGTRTFDANTTYVYNGTSAQATGNGLPASIAGLTVSNATGVNLTSSTATSQLTLTSGILDLGAANITATNLTGGSATSYVKTSGTGYLKMPVSSTNVTFPVGRSTYNPATLNNSGAADNFSVIVNDAMLTNGTSGTTVTNAAVERTWLVSEDVVGGSTVTMTLQWNGASEINSFDDNHVYLVHHNGTIWENYLGVVPPSAAPAATALGGGVFTVTQSGLSNFSPFGVHSGVTPLAINLTDIAAANKGSVNVITWATGHEDAGDRAELERSVDAKDFVSIATIQGKGSNSRYSYEDTKPVAGVNYYRLKMIDNMGAVSYSKVVSASVKGTNAMVTVYPNPAQDVLNISLSQAADFSITLTDVSGKLIQASHITGSSATIDMSKLQQGIYLLKYTNGSQTELFKVVK
jgi:hypothetical protein